jgi:hypothetical protein
VRAREQLAEVLTAAGQTRKALRTLEELVNDYARAGLSARAIATVKKMQRIEPGRKDLEFKLAALVKQQEGPTAGEGQAQTPAAPEPRPEPPSPPPAAPHARPSDFEDILVREMPEADAELHLADGGGDVTALQESALFRDLSTAQLEALISGLQLTSVGPGEIVVAEGEPGSSLYLIASGTVRVYVRTGSGHQQQIRVMRQGDFFGEISLLKGTRRTATITAATRCELLELSRSAVHAIAEEHPQVWTIIEDFCNRRAGSAEERGARGLG